MKERVLEFIMSAFQWCCHSTECQLLFTFWSSAMGLVLLWGFVEFSSFLIGKTFGEEAPLAPPPAMTAKTVKVPRKPKKTSTKKKKSVKKKTKK